MADEPDYYLDIEGLEPDAQAEQARRVSDGGRRPWIGIRFDCCGVYARVYRNKDGTAYLGRCPRCLMQARVRVGPGGSDHRFFTAR